MYLSENVQKNLRLSGVISENEAVMQEGDLYVAVNVEQSMKATVNIKAPGWIKYTAGSSIVGQIFTENDNGTWDWVCNLKGGSKSGKFQLQPGSYKLVYRQKNLKKSEYTLEKNFRINSNKTSSIQL